MVRETGAAVLDGCARVQTGVKSGPGAADSGGRRRRLLPGVPLLVFEARVWVARGLVFDRDPGHYRGLAHVQSRRCDRPAAGSVLQRSHAPGDARRTTTEAPPGGSLSGIGRARKRPGAIRAVSAGGLVPAETVVAA